MRLGGEPDKTRPHVRLSGEPDKARPTRGWAALTSSPHARQGGLTRLTRMQQEDVLLRMFRRW
jgi:hypothetical protein